MATPKTTPKPVAKPVVKGTGKPLPIKTKAANPKPSAFPKPPAKKPLTPAQRAVATLKSDAKATTASRDQVLRNQAAAGRAGRVVKQHGNPLGQSAAKSRPGAGYQPPQPPAAGVKTMNPLQKILTPGSGGIAAAMKGGAERKKGVLRP